MYWWHDKNRQILKKSLSETEKNHWFNALYTGGLFHWFMLDESIIILEMSGLFCRFNSVLMENL